MAETASDNSGDMLRVGQEVLVGDRHATFVYSSGVGAVIRYVGEPRTRVVPLQKLRAASQTGVVGGAPAGRCRLGSAQ